MEKLLLVLMALTFVASATAAEKSASATTPAPEMAMDCSKMTDTAAKKECEEKAKAPTAAPVSK